MGDWTKAAEFVPSWYTGGAKKKEGESTAAAPADAPKPKPAAKQQQQQQQQKHQDPSSKVVATSAATNNLNVNAVAFVMPTQTPARPPPQYQAPAQQQQQHQQQQSKQSHPPQKKKNESSTAPASVPPHGGKHAPSSSSNQSSGKEQQQQQGGGSKRQNPKPKKPPAPQQGSKKATLSPSMGAATGSWVTPPLAPAAHGGGGADSKKNGGGDTLPAMDLGAAAVDSHEDSNKAAIGAALESLGVKHTQRDVERITAKSKMSSAAAAFMPSGFVPKTRAAVVPVSVPKNMPNVAPVVPEENRSDFSLLDTWCLYFDDIKKSTEEEFDPYLICHMSDLPTFWRVFQNVPPVSRQNDNTNYYLFREGVMPKWEDPRNDGGGAWTLKFQLMRSSDVIDATWERLACQVVGENWSEDIRPTIMGLVAKIRPRSISFQIWVSKRIDQLLPQLQDRALATTLAAAMWDYFPHPKPQAAAAAAAAVAASSSGAGSSVGSREGSESKKD